MTLTEVSYYSRRLLPFGIITCILLIVLFYVLQLFFASLSKPKGPVIFINPVFGKIKAPQVDDSQPSSGHNYVLDTVEGQPVTATATANVFFLPPSSTRFGFREKIYLMAKTIGFDTEVIKHQLDNTIATFQDDTQKLTIDITNFNFSYQYNLKQDDPIFTNARIPDRPTIEQQAFSFLKDIGRYPEELAQGKTNVIYLHFDTATNEFAVSPSPRDANAVEVDIYRPDVDGYPIVSPHYYNSQNYVVMIFNDTQVKVVKAQVKFFEKSTAQVGVYPMKTGDTAWEQLKAGKGIIVSNPNNTKDVVIKKMFFGYLDPDTYQDYLEPVYIFLGANNFISYVPATADVYLSQ